MLIPFETIAIILYLASITQSPTLPDPAVSLLAILIGAIICLLLVQLEVLALKRRRSLFSAPSRKLIKICEIANKALGCGITIALLDIFQVYNLYSYILPGLSGNYILQNITGMLIYIFITLFLWLPWYQIHQRTASGSWSYRSYFLHKFRYSFFILGIWLPGILLTEYLNSKANPLSPGELELYTTLLFIVVSWLFPIFLRKFWGCTKLEDQQLITQITRITTRAGVKVNGIYLWSLGGKSIPNAAMVGFLPPFQYLFLSHGLINRLEEEEILGVVGHELGHLKQKHILFYLLMSISLITTIEPFVYLFLQNSIHTIIALIGLFFLYIRFIFAWFSRRFEREADLFSAELLGDYRPLSRGLERIGLACGNIRNEKSWHHYGIAERVWFLQSSFYDTACKERFKQGVKLLRRVAVILFLFLLTATVYLRLHYFTQSTNPTPKLDKSIETEQEQQERWLQLRSIFQDDINKR